MPQDLETAAHPEGLRRVAIDPVSRVEGHGTVTLLLDEQHRVHQVRLHIVEFRGFEKFIEGRPYWEVPVMVQRLCGICPVSHQLAACKAMDRVLGVRQLTPTAEKIRRLMHYGQIMQSHALHFFHLASPDLLFGFDAEVERRHIVAVAGEYPDIALQGVMLRKFGQEIIRVTSGKRVHGTGAVPGGVNKHVARADRDLLRQDIGRMIDWAEGAVTLVQTLRDRNQALFEQFGAFGAAALSLVRADGAMDLYDGVLRARGADGRVLLDGASDQGYLNLIDEEVRPWTYMKFPYLRSLGPEAGWYRVGPLARLLNCDTLPSPRAEARRLSFMRVIGDVPNRGALDYHWARMIEVLHAVEVIAALLDDPDILDGERMATGERVGRGVGCIEAPRGTLIHDYQVGEDDLVTQCNLIVATTHNNQAMNEAVRSVAQQYLDGHELTEGLLNHIEVAIRAYDPCLSCATHALGQMPLDVQLVGADGGLIDRMRRSAVGAFVHDLAAA